VGGDFDLPAPRGRPAAPLLEVLVPLREPVRHEFGGVAQYWIDGAGIVRKFTALDRSLALRSGVAIGAGLAVMLTALAWTFRRLDAANRELRARSEDLARANQEFSFAAKTSAIGAITAHLIHGLRSPLAGLEGYVTGRNGSSSDRRGEEWQTAMETTRRLRGLINEVVDILHEEKAGGAPYAVKTSELFAQAGRKIHALATACGVTLICSVGSDTELPSRRAHLLLLVLDNLLRNACEASPHGGRVTLRAVAASDRVDFLVEDQGPGLNPDVAGHLFQPILSAKPGGGGVGLVISRHLAQHAGGELTLVTSDSRGCCFRLSASVMAARMAGSLSDLP
ncbi:MAG: sensor histidine kinase, partial [Opitutaceae bacterium]